MTRKKIRSTTKSNEFAILTAIWILACNDENPMISYEGLKYRLNLSEDFDIRRLVQKHGELFRQQVPVRRLEEWKSAMKRGRRLPSWIRDIEDKEMRNRVIEALSPNDFFRSQFRAGNNAPRLDTQVIQWGLEHIERLRKSELDKQQQTAKSWEIRIVGLLGLINIFIAIYQLFL